MNTLHKIVWWIVFVAICITFLRLMAWADKDLRGPMKTVKDWPFSQTK